MKFEPKKLRLILLGLLAVTALVFLLTSALGLKVLSQKSRQLTDAKIKERTAAAQLTALETAKKQVAQYGYFNEVAKTVIPDDKDQAQAVQDIYQMASRSGILIASITFPASNLGGASAATPAAGSGAKTTAISQSLPVQGIKGLYSLELTVTPMVDPTLPNSQRVTYAKFLDFLRRVERNRRTAQITQITIQPQGAGGQTIGFSLAINIFMRPQ